MQYFLVETMSGAIVRRHDEDGKVWFLPSDPSNSDVIGYQEWLAEGNTPEPWPPAE